MKKAYLVRREDIFKTGVPLVDVHFLTIGTIWASVLFTKEQRERYPFPITRLED